MGQQSSRKSSSGGGGVGCGCGCGWERRPHTSHVHRYVAALTDRWGSNECSCRRRRACVCTAYRDLSERHDDRLAAVLTLGSGDLRRELDAIVTLNAESDSNRESRESVPELFVLSVAPRSLDSEGSQHSLRSELQQATDASLRLHPHLVMCGSGELKAVFVRAQNNALPAKVHTQVDYIHRLVEDLQEITACSFYWGKMDRYEAERLLDGKPEGTFLLRDSAQEEHLFSVSFRKYGRSLHARIEHFESRFSFDSHDPAVYSARTVTHLLEHYKDPACVMFFEPILTAPLPRNYAFSLQQLARAVIVSRITYDGVESLPLPPRLRAYLKEYHYRQRVRVRRLDSDVLYHPC